MKITLLDWSAYAFLKLLYDVEEIVRILDNGEGNWLVIPTGDDVPYNGTAYQGERAKERAKNFFLN
ncbi:hypothetical protein LCGC14_0507320 [marine sediment metagenome]|uniref:Uncharacterized protein n=1 Tax=marine sediment metagenome TaxID=412755 RepID=A0A0F9S760_9ZZZZ